MSDSFIGRTLGKFHIEAKLGQGGMGKVYRGRQASLNRQVAIKVLSAQMALDPQFVERFQQEARVIATLQHENIVHIYDIDDTRNADGDAIYFIVMELVDGYTLSQRPGAGRPMPASQVRTIGVALARALDFAHRQGIVHRDIKGANVMVTSEGQIKLMDFGIAKSAGGVKTATGSILGTPEYMAPEQARSGEVTAQSDIYSLGVLLYELATGRLPFSGSDPFAIALKHISEQAPRPADIEPSIPPWLESVILRAISKDPAARFASATAVAEALVNAEASPPESRLPPPVELGVTLPLPPTPLPIPPVPPANPPAPALDPARSHQPASDPLTPTRPGPSDSELDPTWAAPTPAEPRPATQPYGGPTAPAAAPTPPPPTLPRGEAPTAPTSPPPRSSRGMAKAALAIAATLALVLVVAAFAFFRGDRSANPETTSQERTQEVAGSGADIATTGVPITTGSPEGLVTREETLVQAREAFDAGELATAQRALETWLESTPDDAEAKALLADVEAAQRQDQALGILEEARSSADFQAGTAVGGATTRDGAANDGAARDRAARDRVARDGAAPRTGPASEAGVTTGIRQPAPPAPPKPSATELRRRAERQKDNKQYHSLKRTLDAWIATGAAPPQANTWRGKVDRWIGNREEDLRDELEDHIDDLIDVIEDRDLDDLSELWGDRLDARTERFFSRLFDRHRRLDVEIQILETRPVDDRIDFVAQILIRAKERRRDPYKDVQRGRWNGRLIDDGDVRFVSSFSG